MLVISVVAIASLIGLAMLSNSSLQAESAAAHARSIAANYLAESGVRTATYYLQRDLSGMPASWVVSGHKIYKTGITVSGVSGSFDIDATTTSDTDVFKVVSVGHSSGTDAMTRTATAYVRVVRASPTYAAGFGGDIIINLGNYFNGPVVSGGLFSGLGLGNLFGGSRSFNSSDFVIPTVGGGQLNHYGGGVSGGTYTMPNGTVGSPQTLSSGTITTASLSALATNPGKVFYYPGNVTITGAGTYTGTIISTGKIELKPPAGSTLVWNRVSGFPAMVSDGQFYVNTKNSTVDINGIVYAGTGTGWAALLAVSGTAVRINGALLAPANQPLAVTGLGSMTVNYTPANNDIVNLATTVVSEPGVGVKFIKWDQ